MPKVSVIIPVFGVEKYIERCARSLFEQTLDDIEYIFIDDCSTDNSIGLLKTLLDDYPQRRKQTIIHKMEKNSGQAAVRKWGMQNATGDYVIHCDGDDWVDKGMYEKLWRKAEEGHFDIVRCNFSRTDGVHQRLCRQIPGSAYKDHLELISYVLRGASLTSLCDKLVRRSVIANNNIIYPTCNMQEDATLVVQLFYYSKKVLFVPETLYYYYRNPQSITQEPSIDAYLSRLEEVMNNTKIILNFLSEKNIISRYQEEVVCRKYNDRAHINSLTSQKKYREKWWSVYPEIDSKILLNRKMHWKEKFEYYSVILGLYNILH